RTSRWHFFSQNWNALAQIGIRDHPPNGGEVANAISRGTRRGQRMNSLTLAAQQNTNFHAIEYRSEAAGESSWNGRNECDPSLVKYRGYTHRTTGVAPLPATC